MTDKMKYSLLIIVLLFFSIIQAPLFYYYLFGVFLWLYAFIGLSINILLLKIVWANKRSRHSFNLVGLLSSFIIGLSAFFFGDLIIEKIDWKLRRKSRKEIVQKVISGELKADELDNWSFPPISNGGNKIIVYKTNEDTYRIEFFINRGLLGHYSAFVYSNDAISLKELEVKVNNTVDRNNTKLEENWYRVSY